MNCYEQQDLGGMMLDIEAMLDEQLKLPEDQRDGALIEECVQTLRYLGERHRNDHTESGAKPGGESRRRVRVGRLWRGLTAAALAAALLACSAAIADSAGLQIGRLFARNSEGRLDIAYSAAEGHGPSAYDAQATLVPDDISVYSPALETYYTPEELFAAAGEGLVYPADACGFAFEKAELIVDESGLRIVDITFKKGGDTVSINEMLFDPSVEEGGFAYNGSYFGSYGEPFGLIIGETECAAAESGTGAVIAFHTAGCHFTIHGQAPLKVLQRMLASALNG